MLFAITKLLLWIIRMKYDDNLIGLLNMTSNKVNRNINTR